MEKTSAATKIFAGGIAGVSETLVTYPAEFIKTRRQLTRNTNCPPSSSAIISATYRASGLSGFYSGCSALATSNAFKAGIRFLTFETVKDSLEKVIPSSTPGAKSPTVAVLAGLSAGVVESILVVTPGEVIKTRAVQSAAANHLAMKRGVLGAAMAVVNEGGPRALWKGLGPVLCKQGTNSAVRFTTFDLLQQHYDRRWPKRKGSVVNSLGLGALSGVVTVYASMPFDNIKTRMQSAGHSYKGMLDCAVRTLREDGVAAFWRGTSPRLVRLTLSSSITFSVYEQVVGFMKRMEMKQRGELQTLRSTLA